MFSTFPNPFLLPLLVTMGINRVPAWKIAIACWLGSAVLFLLLALPRAFRTRLDIKAIRILQNKRMNNSNTISSIAEYLVINKQATNNK